MKTKHNAQVKQIQTNQYKPKPEGEEAAPSASESAETPAPETTAGCELAAQPRARKQRGFAGLKTSFAVGRDDSVDTPGRQDSLLHNFFFHQ